LEQITQSSWHRELLLSREHAACYHCQRIFSPSEVLEWCDDDAQGIGQTAICPFCYVDAVVGFNGKADPDWLSEMYRTSFS
jgi:hypothetical protein